MDWKTYQKVTSSLNVLIPTKDFKLKQFLNFIGNNWFSGFLSLMAPIGILSLLG